MLFHFFTSLIDQYSFLNVFKYLTFRTGLAVMTSLIIVFIIGAVYLKYFDTKKIINQDTQKIKPKRIFIVNNMPT